MRTRFAPSPTGYLHIGGVRTALFNWLLARQSGGQFILRIDDTDRQRNVQQALQPILDGFRWLGIDWDEGPEVGGPCGPYYQSERGEHYQRAVEQLLASGAAYRDFATPEELQAERQRAEQSKQEFVYSRRWMAQTPQQADEFASQGRSAVVRLKMPREGSCAFRDLIRGDLSFEWAREQDHVIQRADGSCLYHLASVVDDEAFAITHVVRAVEHLSNTPRQIFIARSLGYKLPHYAHLPYVAEPGSKNKLSKRKIDQYLKNRQFRQLYDRGLAIAERIKLPTTPESFNPVLVEFYQQVGFLADALVNYLLLLGWSLDDKTEHLTRGQMIEHFSLGRVVKSEASFDPDKLRAFQQRHFNELAPREKVELCLPFLDRAGLISQPIQPAVRQYVEQIVQAAGDRISVGGDILDYDDFFVADPQLVFDPKAFEKRLVKPPNAPMLLAEFAKVLAGVDDVTAANLQRVLQHFVESRGINIGQIIHALRISMTGKPVGFGMFETMQILGRDKCIRRIDLALQHLARVESGSI